MLQADKNRQRITIYAAMALLVLLMMGMLSSGPSLFAQDEAGPSGDAVPAADAPADDTDTAADEPSGLNLFSLLISGGMFMLPILAMSLLTATFAVERGLGLRRSRVMPDELVEEIGTLGSSKGGFDPRKAYRICQQYPSAASNVIRAMLLKVGRPHQEVEHAVGEASEREAERLYSNVRWLNLAAAVTPLLGLFGTVWGMIQAFHGLTAVQAGQNKADVLAEGIYTALVTTLGGLAVAIPASIVAHYLEGKVQTLFHQIDEMLFNLMPQIERYEGRVRFSRAMGEGDAPAAGNGEAESQNAPATAS